MKKFEVMNAIRNAAQIKGEEGYNPENLENLLGDYVDAENEAEAIAIAIDWLVEHVIQNSDYKPEATEKNIMVYDDNEPVEEYYNFTAREIHPKNEPKTEKMNFRASKSLKEKIEELAKLENRTVSNYLENLVLKEIERLQK